MFVGEYDKLAAFYGVYGKNHKIYRQANAAFKGALDNLARNAIVRVAELAKQNGEKA